jgi:predicted DsbA family dithiol-disulfide isomerase
MKQREIAANIRWHPFLLDNTVPASGYEFRSFMRTRKNIGETELQQMFDYAQKAGEAAGVKLDINKISLAVNTTLSHQLIAIAPENIKNDIVEAIYKAYFEENLNLGDIEVIIAIGKAHKINPTELRSQLTDDAAVDKILAESIFARLNNISSVPFFIINNQVKIDGSHSVEVFVQALNRATLLETSSKIC